MKSKSLQPKRQDSVGGFTFIEVLVAMLIFTMAVLAAVDIARGSVRATTDSKAVTLATWLVQGKMVEVETKLESIGFEKACEEKAEGKFDAPYDSYSWRTSCYQIDFKLSEAAAQLAAAQGDKDKEEKATKENAMLKMILNLASTYISDSMREVTVEVFWLQGKTPRQISLTTHVARFDKPINLPSLSMGATN